MQGLDGPPGDKGDDGEAGQAVSVLYQFFYFTKTQRNSLIKIAIEITKRNTV